MKSLIIRLKPRGRLHLHVYEIVVMSRKKRSRGATYEKIGYLTTNKAERTFALNMYKLGIWLNKGAFLHKTLLRYLVKMHHLYIKTL